MGDLLDCLLGLQARHELISAFEHLLGRYRLRGLGAHLLSLGAQSGGLLLGVGAFASTPMLVVGALFEVGVPTEAIDIEDPAGGIEVHDLVDGVAKQIDVVTDDDEAPGVGAQMIAQPQDRIVVEVVGGLVQQKRVRFLEQDAGELDSTSLASRERTDLLVQHPVGKAECRRDPSGFTGGGVATGHGELMIQTRISIQGLGHGIALCAGDPLLGLADACEQGVDAPG